MIKQVSVFIVCLSVGCARLVIPENMVDPNDPNHPPILIAHGDIEYPDIVRETNVVGSVSVTIVTSGIYRYIRHPLYSSLLFLAWGAFLKDISVSSTSLIFISTVFLVATAKADETECIQFFGSAYEN